MTFHCIRAAKDVRPTCTEQCCGCSFMEQFPAAKTPAPQKYPAMPVTPSGPAGAGPTPRTDSYIRAFGEVISNERFDALFEEAHKLERELAAALAERDALREALRVCLCYWISEKDPRDLKGSIAHMKQLCGFEAFIDEARKK